MKLKMYQRRLLVMLLVLLMACATAGMAANAQSKEVAGAEQTEVMQTEAIHTPAALTEVEETEAAPTETEETEPAPTETEETEPAPTKTEQTETVSDLQTTLLKGIKETTQNNELTGINPKCTITEKYVNEDGSSIPDRPDTKEVISRNNNYSKAIVAINGYVVIGYRVGNQNANLIEGNIAQIQKVNNNITVYFVYRKLSTTISISYPKHGGMNFYVNEETYPYIKSNGEGNSGYYTFTNESDYPLKVTFGGMTVQESASLEFVSNAASSAQGSNHISLSLIRPTGISDNGFTNGVSSITSGSAATELGTLKGKHVGGQTTASSGYITIGGYYAGYLGEQEKNLELTFKFKFTLVTR